VTGWLLALLFGVAVVRLRRRLELVARAEHELRGPLTAFSLGIESARRGSPVALDAEFARACAALDDLTAARRGRQAALAPRPLDIEALVRSSAHAWGARVDWRAGSTPPLTADGGRVAQALGNVLANAAEHGGGDVAVEAERDDAVVRIRIANPKKPPVPVPIRIADRGRGLRIADAAARAAGGSLSLEDRDAEFRATLDLPLPAG
jgi:signal transduction histidine kinase